MATGKDLQDVINARLEETAELFRPTAPPVEQGAQEPKRTRKPRAYEQDNPAFAFRIRPEDSERINALAGELAVTRDALGRGLMRAALDAVESGRLALEVEREPVARRDSLGRLRSHVKTAIRATWANLADK